MALALLVSPEQATALYQYLPEPDAVLLAEETERFASLPDDRLATVVTSELESLISSESSEDLLSTIHTEWLAELLQREPPHIIARILDALPDLIKVGLTAYLPKGLLLRLPKLEPLVPRMARLLLRIFLRQFEAVGGGDESRNFMFRSISNLDGQDLQTLVREVGLRLFAVAFQGVDPRALQKLCKRMPARDERLLLEAVRGLDEMSPEDVKRAQKSILTLEIASTREGWLFKEAGLMKLSECLAPEHPKMGAHICYKLDRELGKMLFAYLREFENQPPLDRKQRLKLQDFIVACVYKLAASGRIDPKWKECNFLLRFHGEA